MINQMYLKLGSSFVSLRVLPPCHSLLDNVEIVDDLCSCHLSLRLWLCWLTFWLIGIWDHIIFECIQTWLDWLCMDEVVTFQVDELREWHIKYTSHPMHYINLEVWI